MAKRPKVQRTTKVQVTPGGPQVDAVEVPIADHTERWSDYELEDGTIIKVKQVPLEILKVIDHYDPDGNPLYVLKAQPIVNVSYVPEKLKRKTPS
jgi:hypothetical protein